MKEEREEEKNREELKEVKEREMIMRVERED
jgi:hypothetical protein